MAKKAEDTKPNGVIKVETSSDKTALELEAEISKLAKSAGKKKPKVLPKKKPAAKAKVIKKPTATEPKADPVEDDGAVSIVVKHAPPAAKKSPINDDSEELTKEPPKITGHRGRKIEPLKAKPEVGMVEKIEEEVEVAEEDVEKEEPKEEKPEVDETEEPVAEEEAEKKSSDDSDSLATEKKLDAMADKFKAQKEAQKKLEDEPQVAKIYDTKKYHVPINVNRHHRRNAVPMWAEILILIVGLLGALVYGVWSGVIDVELPFISEKSSPAEVASTESGAQVTDVKLSETVTTEPEVAAAEVESVRQLFDYEEEFNKGDLDLEFVANGFNYSFSGSFKIDAESKISVDLLGDEARTQVERMFEDGLKSLSYSSSSPFSSSQTITYKTNSSLMTGISDGALLGLNQIFAAPLNDISLAFDTSLYSLNDDCKKARAKFIESYDNLKVLSSDISNDMIEVLGFYNSLAEVCGTDGEDNSFVAIDKNVLPDISVDTERTEDSIVITVKNGNVVAVKLTLRNLSLAESIPSDTLELPDFTDMRMIDLSLLAVCSQEAFAEYTAGDSISTLANAAECKALN